ncbi:putative porin [Parapedobacter deserti]|uniref:Porin n=1 Tax=Parapedobacter deserti TaxID=1912957 RepID=A0ABV7JUW9_9SPHI
MKVLLRISLLLLCFFALLPALFAQEEEFSSALDSARAAEDSKEDTVIYTARYIRYTTLAMMKQGTFTYQIDTLHKNFQYYNPQNQPRNPTIHLGSYGLATRDLLFVPNKTIGFQPGFHSLERFLYLSDSIKYYRARAPFSELYNVGFFFDDQIIRAKVTQNINPRLNLGGEFHAARADGYYNNQRYNDIKSALFAWYESENHRYNLLTNVVFNRLTSTENGSILNDTVFRDIDRRPSNSEPTRLVGTRDERPRHTWRDNSLFLRQSLFVGRLDTINAGKPEQQLLPTNRMSHSLSLRMRNFQFYKNEEDIHGAFPFGGNVLAQDTTRVSTITNDFGYSFYLRGKSLAFIKNEVKLDLGYQHDMHWYRDRGYHTFLQNNMLKVGIGYRFSDRISVTGNLNQIVQGANFGDYLYEASADILLSKTIGRITMGAYTQNKSPEWLFQRVNYTYHQWMHDFAKTKTTNFSFAYENRQLGFSGKAEYFLIANHLYFQEVANPNNLNARLLRVIEPTQLGNNINLLKLTASQNFTFGRFHLDNHAVYQQSDYNDVLAIPQLYTWHSIYYNGLLYKIVDFNLGLDVRFNTPFRAQSYAINIGQFYNDNVGIEFSSYPIVDVWTTATLKRANLFLSYNFVNQHIWPAGYYTVRRYPMGNANLRVGIAWKFYD